MRERIVVGVDASEEAKQALRWAIRYAQLTGGSVEAVHSWRLADEYAWVQTLPPPASPTEVAEEGLRNLVAEVAGANPPVEVHTAVVEGHAASVLVEASKDAALLVVGSTGLGGFAGLHLGSVSQQCAAHAPCSVVVVR